MTIQPATPDPRDAMLNPPDVWGSHTDYPRADWQHEVCNGDTNLGYWEWCLHKWEADNL